MSSDFTAKLQDEGRWRLANNPEEGIEALAKVCRETFATPHGTVGVDCFEWALGPVPREVRNGDRRDPQTANNAIRAAMGRAMKCQADR